MPNFFIHNGGVPESYLSDVSLLTLATAFAAEQLFHWPFRTAGSPEQVVPIFFIHNSGVQEVGDILALLVQQGLGSPVALNGLEALRGLHLPGYDESPCLQAKTADVQC